MISRTTITRLLVAALILPIALSVTWGTGQLLEAMGDTTWAQILYRICLIGGILWVIDLVCLLVAVAVFVVAPDDSSDSAGDSS